MRKFLWKIFIIFCYIMYRFDKENHFLGFETWFRNSILDNVYKEG